LQINTPHLLSKAMPQQV